MQGSANGSGLVLHAFGLTRFGADVLSGIELAVPPATVTALIGANGAGKSSLIRTVVGALTTGEKASGRIVLGTSDLTLMPLEQRVRAGLGWCPEGRRVFPTMTVRDTLEVACPGNAIEREHRIAEMADLFPELADHMDRRAWMLSGGQQQMLALARALIRKPSALVLDEPTLGLAPVVLERLAERIRRIADEGCAVLLVEANAHWALGLADRAVLLARGRVVAAGPTDQIVGSAQLDRVLVG